MDFGRVFYFITLHILCIIVLVSALCWDEHGQQYFCPSMHSQLTGIIYIMPLYLKKLCYLFSESEKIYSAQYIVSNLTHILVHRSKEGNSKFKAGAQGHLNIFCQNLWSFVLDHLYAESVIMRLSLKYLIVNGKRKKTLCLLTPYRVWWGIIKMNKNSGTYTRWKKIAETHAHANTFKCCWPCEFQQQWGARLFCLLTSCLQQKCNRH